MADTADVPVFHGDVYLQRYNSALVVTISEAEEQIEKTLAAYDPSHFAAKKGAAKTAAPFLLIVLNVFSDYGVG